MFSDEYSVRKRKFDSYFSGEALFGLPHQNYPSLEDTRKEIELLDKQKIGIVQPKTMSIQKNAVEFIQDFFDEHTKNTLIKADFLKSLFEFSQNDKDNINEETIEILEPYLTLKFPTGEDLFTG